MFPPVSLAGPPVKPFNTNYPQLPLRFGGGDSFVRFGNAQPPEEGGEKWDPDELWDASDPRFEEPVGEGEDAFPDWTDDELWNQVRRIMHQDVDLMYDTLYDMDIRFFRAMDEGNCEKARGAMYLKAQVMETLLSNTPQNLDDLPDIEAIRERAQAAPQIYQERQALKGMEWATFLRDAGLEAEDDSSLQKDRSELEGQLSNLMVAVEAALEEKRDKDAIALYAEYKEAQAERAKLGDED